MFQCAGCSRHVKERDALCPFCGARLGLTRAVSSVATGGILGVALTGCGKGAGDESSASASASAIDAASRSPAGSGSSTPSSAAAATRAIRLPRTRGLWLYNKNTDEHLRLAHVRNGFYDRNALRRLDWHLRDHHVQRYHQMNRKLFDVLYVVQQRFGADRPLLITSGYRTRSTNERLAERIPGVASNSLHISGKAVDFQIPERSPRSICNYLNDLHIGGVGRYSTHVHFDVGKVRKW